jgi:phosphoribosylformylglycinamidine (FGAM) synthase PurS component
MLGIPKNNESFNEGVTMLLNRMDSHPEEFPVFVDITVDASYVGHRWGWAIKDVVKRVEQEQVDAVAAKRLARFLTDAEVHALYDKLIAINRNYFRNAVMEELLNPNSQQPPAFR